MSVLQQHGRIHIPIGMHRSRSRVCVSLAPSTLARPAGLSASRRPKSLAVAKRVSMEPNVPSGSHLLFLLRYIQTKIIFPYFIMVTSIFCFIQIYGKIIGNFELDFITPSVRFKKLRHKLWRGFGGKIIVQVWTTTVLQSIHHRIVHLY